MKIICKIVIPFFLLNIGGSFINAQTVNLSDFTLIPNNKQVILFWTIDSGPTCNGISILHSKDSLHFTEIGDIPGICGSSDAKKPYNYTDEHPVLGEKNYYKIKLGSNQYSEIRSVLLQYREQGKLYVIPNSANERVSLEFNNDNAREHALTIYSASGKTIFEIKGVRGDKIEVQTGPWDDGTYYAFLKNENGQSTIATILIRH